MTGVQTCALPISPAPKVAAAGVGGGGGEAAGRGGPDPGWRWRCGPRPRGDRRLDEGRGGGRVRLGADVSVGAGRFFFLELGFRTGEEEIRMEGV